MTGMIGGASRRYLGKVFEKLADSTSRKSCSSSLLMKPSPSASQVDYGEGAPTCTAPGKYKRPWLNFARFQESHPHRHLPGSRDTLASLAFESSIGSPAGQAFRISSIRSFVSTAKDAASVSPRSSGTAARTAIPTPTADADPNSRGNSSRA